MCYYCLHEFQLGEQTALHQCDSADEERRATKPEEDPVPARWPGHSPTNTATYAYVSSRYRDANLWPAEC